MIKNDLALIYNQALVYYEGNKQKANSCVEMYCRGLVEGNNREPM